MIRISKNIWFNPAEISVFGIKCTFSNIAKIINLLDYKWLLVTIDSLTEDSPLLNFIKNQGLECFLKQNSSDYIEVSVVIPYSLVNDVLEKAISEYPENIFVFNLLDPKKWDIYLQHSFEELVVNGITNAFISIALDENALLICINKSIIDPRKLYRQIKELRFD